MRHAKSDWSHNLDDHDRPLNLRGQKASAALGGWLSEQALWPTLALISSAARTQETWTRLAPPDEVATQKVSRLYLANPGQILQEIQRVEEADTLLVLGHNPGIAEIAHWLAQRPADHPDFDRYPTGATTVLRFDHASWSEIQPGSGTVEHFVTPRALTKG